MNMVSYQVCECGAPLQRVEQQVPTPRGTELLLKVLAAGICHTDLHVWDGYYAMGGGKKLLLSERGVKLPLTMGHENVGQVVEVGPEVEGIAVGDVRLVNPWIGCGECKVCRRGQENLCLKPRSIGVFSQGGYATHILVPHPRHLFSIGTLTPTEAAPLACSGLTAYSALRKLSAPLDQQELVIIGAGGVGLMAVALARSMGAKQVVVVDIDPEKSNAALAAGATRFVNAGASDASRQIQQATGGGADAIIDFVGSGESLTLALASITKGATIVVVGLFGGEVTIPTPSLPLRAMTLCGSYVGTHAELAELLDLLNRTGAPTLPIHKRPLSEVGAALGELRAGRVVGRLVLQPQETN